MNSAAGDPIGPGFPIRTSADQSSLAAPHGFSQRVTSFIASVRQGIHQMLFKRLIQQNPSHADPKRKKRRPPLQEDKRFIRPTLTRPLKSSRERATDFSVQKTLDDAPQTPGRRLLT